MTDYTCYLNNKKNNNATISKINELGSSINDIYIKIADIKLKIKSFEDTFNNKQDLNNKRFGEIYHHLAKLENCYYTGLSTPLPCATDCAENAENAENSENAPSIFSENTASYPPLGNYFL
jgi:hypothetical protein